MTKESKLLLGIAEGTENVHTSRLVIRLRHAHGTDHWETTLFNLRANVSSDAISTYCMIAPKLHNIIYGMLVHAYCASEAA